MCEELACPVQCVHSTGVSPVTVMDRHKWNTSSTLEDDTENDMITLFTTFKFNFIHPVTRFGLTPHAVQCREQHVGGVKRVHKIGRKSILLFHQARRPAMEMRWTVHQ